MPIVARLAALAALALLTARAAPAHHAPYGQYSIDDTIDFTGEVVGVEWVNPHASVLVRAEADGKEVVYRIELQSLRQLHEKGWRGNELELGTTARIVNAALAVAAGSTRVCCARIYDLNGREYFTDPRR